MNVSASSTLCYKDILKPLMYIRSATTWISSTTTMISIISFVLSFASTPSIFKSSLTGMIISLNIDSKYSTNIIVHYLVLLLSNIRWPFFISLSITRKTDAKFTYLQQIGTSNTLSLDSSIKFINRYFLYLIFRRTLFFFQYLLNIHILYYV